MLDIESMKGRLVEGLDGREVVALIEEVERLREALSELIWGCENGGMRPSPVFDDARRVLGDRDPLRFICGRVDEEPSDAH